jgi:hypothetical protein
MNVSVCGFRECHFVKLDATFENVCRVSHHHAHCSTIMSASAWCFLRHRKACSSTGGVQAIRGRTLATCYARAWRRIPRVALENGDARYACSRHHLQLLRSYDRAQPCFINSPQCGTSKSKRRRPLSIANAALIDDDFAYAVREHRVSLYACDACVAWLADGGRLPCRMASDDDFAAAAIAVAAATTRITRSRASTAGAALNASTTDGEPPSAPTTAPSTTSTSATSGAATTASTTTSTTAGTTNGTTASTASTATNGPATHATSATAPPQTRIVSTPVTMALTSFANLIDFAAATAKSANRNDVRAARQAVFTAVAPAAAGAPLAPNPIPHSSTVATRPSTLARALHTSKRVLDQASARRAAGELTTGRRIRFDAMQPEEWDRLQRWWTDNTSPSPRTTDQIIVERPAEGEPIRHRVHLTDATNYRQYERWSAEERAAGRVPLSFSTFVRARPVFVRTQHGASCACARHEQPRLLLDAYIRHRNTAYANCDCDCTACKRGCRTLGNDVHEWLRAAVCSSTDINATPATAQGEEAMQCIRGLCAKCGVLKLFCTRDSTNEHDEVEWRAYVGPRDDCVRVDGSPATLVAQLASSLQALLLHSFRCHWAHAVHRDAIARLPSSSTVVCSIDYSERIVLIPQTETQQQFYHRKSCGLLVACAYVPIAMLDEPARTRAADLGLTTVMVSFNFIYDRDVETEADLSLYALEQIKRWVLAVIRHFSDAALPTVRTFWAWTCSFNHQER